MYAVYEKFIENDNYVKNRSNETLIQKYNNIKIDNTLGLIENSSISNKFKTFQIFVDELNETVKQFYQNSVSENELDKLDLNGIPKISLKYMGGEDAQNPKFAFQLDFNGSVQTLNVDHKLFPNTVVMNMAALVLEDITGINPLHLRKTKEMDIQTPNAISMNLLDKTFFDNIFVRNSKYSIQNIFHRQLTSSLTTDLLNEYQRLNYYSPLLENKSCAIVNTSLISVYDEMEDGVKTFTIDPTKRSLNKVMISSFNLFEKNLKQDAHLQTKYYLKEINWNCPKNNYANKITSKPDNSAYNLLIECGKTFFDRLRIIDDYEHIEKKYLKEQGMTNSELKNVTIPKHFIDLSCVKNQSGLLSAISTIMQYVDIQEFDDMLFFDDNERIFRNNIFGSISDINSIDDIKSDVERKIEEIINKNSISFIPNKQACSIYVVFDGDEEQNGLKVDFGKNGKYYSKDVGNIPTFVQLMTFKATLLNLGITDDYLKDNFGFESKNNPNSIEYLKDIAMFLNVGKNSHYENQPFYLEQAEMNLFTDGEHLAQDVLNSLANKCLKQVMNNDELLSAYANANDIDTYEFKEYITNKIKSDSPIVFKVNKNTNVLNMEIEIKKYNNDNDETGINSFSYINNSFTYNPNELLEQVIVSQIIELNENKKVLEQKLGTQLTM